jgi:hypothetical protein
MGIVRGRCAFLLVLLPATVVAQQFGDWSEPVNLGPVVNSRYVDSCVTISKNGLSLFFSSTRQSPRTNDRDLYVSKRASVDEAWGEPQPLTMLNTPVWESCPALSPDEQRLYFTRPGSCGGIDIHVSSRESRWDDFGWEPPVNLGCHPDGPNSRFGDQTPALFEDEAGRVLMYFTSFRSGNWDHYQSAMSDDGTFGPAVPIRELNSPLADQGVTVRRDGLEVIFLRQTPARPPWGYSMDFWTSTRASTNDPWSPPVYVASLGSPALAQGKISLSFDGRELYFASWRPHGNQCDLWVATRTRLRGK